MDEGIDELTKNSKFFSKYELCMDEDGYLGRGTFSVCRKCRRLEDGHFFAVKIVSQRYVRKLIKSVGHFVIVYSPNNSHICRPSWITKRKHEFDFNGLSRQAWKE